MPNIQVSYLHSQAKVGDRVFIGVTADSEGQLIDGMDVMMTFSSCLMPLSYIPSQLMPVHNYNTGLPLALSNGLFAFSQLCNGGQPLAVKGLIAVIECKAISKGYANIQFKYTLGSTTDTNMASQGQDILTKVVNKRITIT